MIGGHPRQYLTLPTISSTKASNGYSNRNARSGLILDARRAGIQHANAPTNINRTDTVTIVQGSLGTTP